MVCLCVAVSAALAEDADERDSAALSAEIDSVFGPVRDPDAVLDGAPQRVRVVTEASGELPPLPSADEDFVQDDEEWLPPETSRRPPRVVDLEAGEASSGLDFDHFMGRSFMTWVIGGRDRIGEFSLESRGVLELGGRPGLHSSLGYGIRFLDGPTRSDLPPRLFELHYGFKWRDAVSDEFGYEVAVAPGLYTDFEDSAREGYRMRGHGYGYLALNDRLQVALGATYLDRETTKLLPVAGVIWTPDDCTRLSLLFPQPRAARRVRRDGRSETWIYAAGEYGGNSWAIERAGSGRPDVITLDELRLSVGVETFTAEDHSSFIEVGWLFDRSLGYKSGLGDFRPGDALMLRSGGRF
ncbi:MAG: hypothetical protein KY476_08420 [Planctomycetes bacterium]|nr:hypothetical protein [Planctomycetota bacterium]